MQAQQKEEQILRAAEELFTAHRFHEVTMDDVCRAAGVGKGTIYRYFKDKDELFYRLMTSGFDDLNDRIRDTAAGQGEFPEQLASTLQEVRTLLARRRPLFRILQSEETRLALCRDDLRARMMENRQTLVRLMAELLQRGIDDGAIRSDIPAEFLATILLGMLRSSALLGEGAPESDQSVSRIADLFLRGAACPVSLPAEHTL